MNILLYANVTVLTLILLGCKVDPSITINQTCMESHLINYFPSEDPSYNCCNCPVDWQEVYSGGIPFDYFYPCLNPNNNDQMVYYRGDNSQIWFSGFQIYRIDFCSNETILLVDNAFYGIDWSKSGWIFYTAVDQNIYKVKDNGDSLTQITFTTGGYNRYPKTSPSGNKVMYQSEVEGITSLLILDLLSGTVDTIETTPAIFTWNWLDNDRIFYTKRENNTQGLFIFNVYTRQEKKLHDISLGGGSLNSKVISAIPLLNENSILWCSSKVIGKTNLSTGNYSIILKTFKQELLLGISVSNDESIFLLNKRTMHQIDDCYIDSNYDFFIVDKNGNKQKKLVL
ncbi:MAG TPA: hypothetical protein VK168_18315 [Saprospiraceae bacterium]|nr:hypothetical protein [Saprospiraceae bacterium]